MAVGIKDVARAASVSPATVSRVLAGRAVDAAMQQRVRAAVEATGYRPNLAARRLRSQHSQTVGLIVADLRNPFFTAVSRAVEDVAYQQGLRVILCNTDEDPEKEAMYLQLMQAERITGVILAPARQSRSTGLWRDMDFPVVLIDRVRADAAVDGVTLDNAPMAEALVEQLHREGHRRIAGVFGTSQTAVERQEGFVRAMTRLGLTPTAMTVAHGRDDLASRLVDCFAGPSRPTALLTSNGLLTTAVIGALHDLGLSVPEHVAIAGFDHEPWMRLVGGGLTVVEQPVEQIGREAMALLTSRLAHPQAAPRRLVLGGRCIVRGSSALGRRADERLTLPRAATDRPAAR